MSQNGHTQQRAAHFFMNAKGGVGKSHYSVLLLQAYRAAGLPVIGIDADATSSTFSSFKSLKNSPHGYHGAGANQRAGFR